MNSWSSRLFFILAFIISISYIGCRPEPIHIKQIELMPPIDLLLSIGDSVTFIAIAHYDDGSLTDVTKAVEWSIDYDNGDIDSDGTFTATKEGLSHIVATLDGVRSNTVKVGVANPGSSVAYLTVFPDEVPYMLVDYPKRFYAFIAFSNSHDKIGIQNGLEWGSSDDRLKHIGEGIFTPIKAGTSRVNVQLPKLNMIAETDDITIHPLPEVDYDNDMLSEEMEAYFNTDPENPDTDSDMLSDGLEVYGLPGLDLPSYGCNPLKKDLFIHLDWMVERNGVEYAPKEEILSRIALNFSTAPLSNPDGSSGISLHIDAGDRSIGYPIELSEGGNLVPFTQNMQGFNYADHYKDHYQDPLKRNVVRYGLIGHRYNESDSSGLAYLGGYTFIITLYEYTGYDALLIGTLIHEFGHNIGLHHAGVEPHPNFKPNYNSVMNYAYQFTGADIDGDAVGDGVLEAEEAEDFRYIHRGECYTYSSGDLIALDENHLNEYEGVNGTVWIDWDGDDIIEEDVKEDINRDADGEGDGIYEVLTDFDDWRNLTYQETLHTLQDKYDEYTGILKIEYDYSRRYQLPDEDCPPVPFHR
jgi:hypothetical protein